MKEQLHDYSDLSLSAKSKIKLLSKFDAFMEIWEFMKHLCIYGILIMERGGTIDYQQRDHVVLNGKKHRKRAIHCSHS